MNSCRVGVDSAGLTQIEKYTEYDKSKLYVPSGTQGQQDEAKIAASFGLPGMVASVYGVTSPEGGNVLTTDNVLTVCATCCQRIRSIECVLARCAHLLLL